MNPLTIVFFGSFQSYSVKVLEKLLKNFTIVAVVTTPPKPSGRHLEMKHTEVELFARAHSLSIFTPENVSTLSIPIRPDFLVVAGYGKLIPPAWLTFPKVMALNIHQSLLPQYRGAFPAEWAILRGEKETGVTLVKMSMELDCGEIYAQAKIPIDPTDTRETIYKKLYDLGGDMLVEYLPKIKNGSISATAQPAGDFFFARRITRQDGYVPWKEFQQALIENPTLLDIKHRAFTPWPGVWTMTPNGKRLKLTSLNPPTVQLEGKKPVAWSLFKACNSEKM